MKGIVAYAILGTYAILAILYVWWLWTDYETAQRLAWLPASILLRVVLMKVVAWKRARRDRQREQDVIAALRKDPHACLQAIAQAQQQ
jgi:hypothetical protein